MPNDAEQVKFSIVTPSFNQGKYLEKTILSVLDQSYPNLEYIVIDGGSTDNSVEIIQKYEKHLTYWVSEKDRGQSHAINKGFEHASGDLFGWLNSDDFFAPKALETVAGVFLANPAVGAILGAGNMVNERGEQLQYTPPFEVSVETLCQWIYRHFWQPSCFFTREAWEACGPLDEKYHFAMDLDLWFKIAERFSFATTEMMLSSSLQHENAKTTAQAVQSTVEAVLVTLAHGGEQQVRKNLGNYLAHLEEQYKKSEEQHKIKEEQLVKIIKDLQNTLSWKLTAPLRSFCYFFTGKKAKIK